MVSTHLKNISQFGSSPQVRVKINNIWNHHLVNFGFQNLLSNLSFSKPSKIPEKTSPSPMSRHLWGRNQNRKRVKSVHSKQQNLDETPKLSLMNHEIWFARSLVIQTEVTHYLQGQKVGVVGCETVTHDYYSHYLIIKRVMQIGNGSGCVDHLMI